MLRPIKKQHSGGPAASQAHCQHTAHAIQRYAMAVRSTRGLCTGALCMETVVHGVSQHGKTKCTLGYPPQPVQHQETRIHNPRHMPSCWEHTSSACHNQWCFCPPILRPISSIHIMTPASPAWPRMQTPQTATMSHVSERPLLHAQAQRVRAHRC